MLNEFWSSLHPKLIRFHCFRKDYQQYTLKAIRQEPFLSTTTKASDHWTSSASFYVFFCRSTSSQIQTRGHRQKSQNLMKHWQPRWVFKLVYKLLGLFTVCRQISSLTSSNWYKTFCLLMNWIVAHEMKEKRSDNNNNNNNNNNK